MALCLGWALVSTSLHVTAADIDLPESTADITSSGSLSADAELSFDDLWLPWSSWQWDRLHWYYLSAAITGIFSIQCFVGAFGSLYMHECGGGTWDSSISTVVERDMGRCAEPETKEVICCG